jgi:WD40 repeat protein
MPKTRSGHPSALHSFAACGGILLAALLGSADALSAEPANRGGDKPILVLDAGGHTSVVKRLCFTIDGKELISVSEDKTIRFWDVRTGEPLRVLHPPIREGVEGKLYAAALAPGDRKSVV